VYRVEPIRRPAFEPAFAVNGLVELIALEDGALLALERSYVAEAARPGRGANRIRLFRISLAGATDVSALDSLKDVSNPAPVAKVPLLDLSDLDGLGRLAPRLDNFEAMAFGPTLPGGRRSLLLVSDDNFNPTQRTWFLLLGMAEARAREQIQ
jgi:glycerophosphoryl diester phosphodiesterase